MGGIVNKTEKLRIKRIKINQKAAKTLKKIKLNGQAITGTGRELGLAIVQSLTKRQLKHILLQPERFTSAFPEAELPRLAEDELFERTLTDNKEESNG
jgi:hypothetical protein